MKTRLEFYSTVFVGSSAASNTDGTGTSATLNGPQGICYDQVNSVFYVSDISSSRIRKVTSAGVVTRIASCKRFLLILNNV